MGLADPRNKGGSEDGEVPSGATVTLASPANGGTQPCDRSRSGLE